MSDEAERKALLNELAALDTETLRWLAAAAKRAKTDIGVNSSAYLAHLKDIAESDVAGLRKAEQSYGVSWKLRGGFDTTQMLSRKWNRLEERLRAAREDAPPYDIFKHIKADRAADGVIDDVRDLRRYLLLVEAEVAARAALGVADSDRGFLDQLAPIAAADIALIEDKEKTHGASWKKNGGGGAFMILARKWDRIKERLAQSVLASGDAPAANAENVLEHIAADRRAEPILEDIRGLRQYLMLVEAEMIAQGVAHGAARDNRE